MVVAKWCKCLNLKLCLVNPPTPVADIKWISENTSMKKCGESKVQGNVVTMELDKMVQTRMVSGWQVWKCFNCNIDVCAIDMNNNVALVNMEMEDNDDISQMQLDSSHIYSDCFGVIVDTTPPSEEALSLSSSANIPERDPNNIESFNRLQQHVDAYLIDAERVMEKRIRQYIKEQNEIFNQLRSKVNTERTIIWRKMCSVANSTATPVQPVLSSTPSTTNPTVTISTPSTTSSSTTSSASARARAGSVSRPHSKSVSGTVAPFAGSVSNDKPVLGSTFGTISGFNVPGSAPIPKPIIATEVPYTPEPSVPPLPVDPQPVTPPKPKTEPAKPDSGTKWQATRPGSGNFSTTAAPTASTASTSTKRHVRRPSSPSIFSFDDEEDVDDRQVSLDDSSDDEIVEEYTATVHPPKIPDSINLLGSSLPVSIPARMNPTNHSTRAPPPSTSTTSTPKKATPAATNANATGSPSTIAPTTVSMSTVSMATVSSTAPTHQYHALRPQTQNLAPLSSSAASNTNELMVPKQSWRENFLGEAAEESLPAEMASSFIIPLSLNRRLKSLI